MYNDLDDDDKKMFNFDHSSYDWEESVKVCLGGMRKFLLKEEPETMPKAQTKLKQLKIVDAGCKVAFCFAALYYVFLKFNLKKN